MCLICSISNACPFYLRKGSSMKTKFLGLISSLVLVACTASVTQQEIAQAKFPPQPNQAAVDKELILT